MNTAIQKPEVCKLPDGRIGLFVGGGYMYVPAEIALAFAEAIKAAVDQSGEA